MEISHEYLEIIRKTYVDYLGSGYYADIPPWEVNDRNPNHQLADLPNYVYGFRFHDVLETTTTDGIALRSENMNYSGVFYVGGTIFTLAQVENNEQNTAFLIKEMRTQEWTHIIKTRNGNFEPFYPEIDVVIE